MYTKQGEGHGRVDLPETNHARGRFKTARRSQFCDFFLKKKQIVDHQAMQIYKVLR